MNVVLGGSVYTVDRSDWAKQWKSNRIRIRIRILTAFTMHEDGAFQSVVMTAGEWWWVGEGVWAV